MKHQLSFTLKEEHLKLLEQLNINYSYGTPYGGTVIPQINDKRLFGNSTGWEEVAEILKLEPENKDGYSEQQILTCKLLIVELGMALSMIFKNRTIKTGTYSITDIDWNYYSYRNARNYLYVESFVQKIEEEQQEKIPRLRSVARGIDCDEEDELEIYKTFYTQLSFGNPEEMKAQNIPWLTSTLEKLEDLISKPIEEKKG